MHRKDTRCAVSFVVCRLVHECRRRAEEYKEEEEEEEMAEGRTSKESERKREETRAERGRLIILS